ncbi:hypothetical protein ACHQM5_012992 [Ranunculus cassubicifolius]
MASKEETTTKPPSAVHLSHGLLTTAKDSNAPQRRLVVETLEAMNNGSGVKSNGEDNVNGMHGSTDSLDGSSSWSTGNQATECEENGANKMVHTPVKRGRGRPPKPKNLSTEEAVVYGPQRQRGRPRNPLSAVAMSPKAFSGRGRGRPRKQLNSFSNNATPSHAGDASTIKTTKVESKTSTTTTTTKGSTSADASESTTTSTTTESTATTTVVETS